MRYQGEDTFGFDGDPERLLFGRAADGQVASAVWTSDVARDDVGERIEAMPRRLGRLGVGPRFSGREVSRGSHRHAQQPTKDGQHAAVPMVLERIWITLPHLDEVVREFAERVAMLEKKLRLLESAQLESREEMEPHNTPPPHY